MIIEEIQVFHVSMSLKEPWTTAFSTETAIESVIVGMKSGAITGWGEAAPCRLPQYSSEWAAGAYWLISNVFAPELVGRDVQSGGDLQDVLARYKGNFFGKAALDLAWWDLSAKISKQPLWKFIGSDNRTIALGADIPILAEMDKLLSRIADAQAFGFKRIKLKFRRESGLEMVRHARETFPDIVMHVDCNGSFTLDDTDMLCELDQFGLAMIEQPLGYDDLLDHARLQKQLKTPICLDESLTTVDLVRKAIDIGACQWVNLKTGRMGGLTNAIKAHDLCQAKDIPCWVGGMLESSVGQGASMALATLGNIRYPNDIFPSRRMYERDLGYPEVATSNALMELSSDPGQGYEPSCAMLNQCTIAQQKILPRCAASGLK